MAPILALIFLVSVFRVPQNSLDSKPRGSFGYRFPSFPRSLRRFAVADAMKSNKTSSPHNTHTQHRVMKDRKILIYCQEAMFSFVSLLRPWSRGTRDMTWYASPHSFHTPRKSVSQGTNT